MLMAELWLLFLEIAR